ncbi:MAG: NAD/NADP octopine/nopaline dehydrogenase family protein [Promethearchaeota archaeon]
MEKNINQNIQQNQILNLNQDNQQIKFTVIGAGNGGRAFAVYLSKCGYIVNLVYRTKKNIIRIKKSRKIEAKGEISGIFDLNMVTNNYKRALKGTHVILYVVPASVQSTITKKIAPYLEDGQIIVLNPGRTWGAIETYNILSKYRPDLEIYIAETQTLLFTCRKLEDYGIDILRFKESVDCCFYPENLNQIVGSFLKNIFPKFNIVHDIRITSLNNMGAVIHPTVTLLNAGSILRNEDFFFYQEGISPEIARMVEKIDKERCHIIEALGLEPITLKEWAHTCYNCRSESIYEIFHEIDSYKSIKAPQSLNIRYITEDIPTGLVPLSSLGRHLNVSTPTINALIILANTLMKKNFWKIGRTIENIKLPLNYRRSQNFQYMTMDKPEILFE